MPLCRGRFSREMNRREQGREAEDRAAEFLDQLGYTLVTRRWTGRHGELDLVAMDGETLVFVEVKFRRRGAAEMSVSGAKSQAMLAVAAEYAAKFGFKDVPQRFDLVALDDESIRHYPDIYR